jgi:hypothetical protein
LTRLQPDRFLTAIDGYHLAQEGSDVPPRSKQAPDWPRNVRSSEDCGGDLVKQWLEQVMITTVNKGNLDVGLMQFLNKLYAGEAATNDNDVMI